MEKRLIPSDCKSSATINYSMLNLFKPANIFRFFCLSLYRDEYFYVRITLDDIKRMTGDKSLGNFNKDFKEFLNIKSYYIDNGFEALTRRNIYRVPSVEEECVIFSRRIIGLGMDAAHAGFFMQLVLISKFANIELTKANIIKFIHMDSKTYDKYITALLVEELLNIKENKLVLKGEEYILGTGSKEQIKFSKNDLNKRLVPQFNLKFD